MDVVPPHFNDDTKEYSNLEAVPHSTLEFGADPRIRGNRDDKEVAIHERLELGSSKGRRRHTWWMPWKVFAGVAIAIVHETIAGVVGGVKASKSPVSQSSTFSHHIINHLITNHLVGGYKDCYLFNIHTNLTDSARRAFTADRWYFILNTDLADNPRILETTLYLENDVALEHAYSLGDNIS